MIAPGTGTSPYAGMSAGEASPAFSELREVERSWCGGASRNCGDPAGSTAPGHGISEGAPHSGGADSDPAAGSDPRGIAAGVDNDRARDRVDKNPPIKHN